MEKTVPQAQFVVNAQGKKTGVLLSLKQYQKLLEDLHDLAVSLSAAMRSHISLEEMQRRWLLLRVGRLEVVQGHDLACDNVLMGFQEGLLKCLVLLLIPGIDQVFQIFIVRKMRSMAAGTPERLMRKRCAGL